MLRDKSMKSHADGSRLNPARSGWSSSTGSTRNRPDTCKARAQESFLLARIKHLNSVTTYFIGFGMTLSAAVAKPGWQLLIGWLFLPLEKVGSSLANQKLRIEKAYRQACGGRFYAPPHAKDGETEGCRSKRP